MTDARDLLALQERVGHRFSSQGLLEQALVHASARDVGGCNQRLEFLGDAVLGLVVAERLFGRHPDAAEGPLTRARARLVSATSLARCGRAWGLDRALVTGPGMHAPSDSVISDTTEAVIGAVYLDGGLEAARAVIQGVLGEALETAVHTGQPSWKTALQEYTQARGEGVPDYRVLDSSGPDHQKSFLVACHLDGVEYGRGRGRSKRSAEQAAAKRALGARLSGDGEGEPTAPPPGPLLHIVPRDEWEQAQATGRYAPVSLAAEGFVHCSLPWQVLGVAEARFAGRDDLLLLELDADDLDGRLVYEDCYETTRAYPHVYAALRPEQVRAVYPFPGGRGFALPAALAHDLDPV